MKRIFFCLLCCIMSVVSFAQAKNKPTKPMPVKEGNDGYYLFVSNQAVSPRNKASYFSGGTVFRAIGDGEWKEIGKIGAVESLESFKRVVGAETVAGLMKLKRLSSEQALWDYVLAHPRIDDYGLLGVDVKFLEAMGTCYADRSVNESLATGTTIHYKINLQPGGTNTRSSTVEGTVLKGMKPVIVQPSFSSLTEDDSVLIVKWKAPVQGSDDALFGNVWRRKGNYGNYEFAGKVLANKDSSQRQITYTWFEKTTPSTQYHFYIVPVTLTGLPGPVSDTAAGISRDFKHLAQSTVLYTKDTARGIWLSWEALPQTTFTSGIIIERSRNSAQGFVVIDTIAPSLTNYLDEKMAPNVMYNYRIRTLSIRQDVLDVSAQAAAMHKDERSYIEAPLGLSATGEADLIRLSWKKSLMPDVAGYYVYRSTSANRDWELISNLQADTVFVDSAAHNARVQYKYVVVAANYAGIKSDFSAPAFASLTKIVLPAAPLGVLVGGDAGRIIVSWKDMRQQDELIAGYNIYRRPVTPNSQADEGEISPATLKQRGFVLVNKVPVRENVFSDPVNGSFAYAITSVNMKGTEGNAYGSFAASSTAVALRAPADVSARKTSKGVEITWGANLQPGLQQYVVYRREASEKVAVQIGTVALEQTNFTDTKASAGKLYFYSVKSTGAGGASEASLEKGVRM
jgi:hypothetical protein